MDPELKSLLERGVVALERIAAELKDTGGDTPGYGPLNQIASAMYGSEGRSLVDAVQRRRRDD